MSDHNIHIYTVGSRRVRRICPFHRRRCYGALREYYDTARVDFDCGTSIDYGYGEWRPPPKRGR